MVEHDHQLGDGGIELDPLVVAEGLAQGVATIITLEVNGSTPGLDQAVDRGHGQGLATLAEEDWIVVSNGD